MKKILTAAIVLSAALVLAGCGDGDGGDGNGVSAPVTVPGETPYTLTLSENSLSAFTESETQLPKPTALDGAGADVSASVQVEVHNPDGSIYVPAHRYALYDSFTAYRAGDYVAVYSVEDENGSVAARAYATVSVTDVPVEETGIEIDGVLDDAKYSLSSVYYTGVNGNLAFKYYFGEDGIYLGVNVKDKQIVYNDYVVSRFTQSDGFEIYLNLSESSGDLLNDQCFKLQVNTMGLVRVYGASEGKAIFELNERIVPEYKLQINGTRTDVNGGTQLSYYDEDAGYTFEAYLSYAQLGIAHLPDAVGIAFAHRDVSDISASLIGENGNANQYYRDVAIPAGVNQIILDNGNTYEVSTYDPFALTCLYNTLYLKGGQPGIAVPQQTASVSVDGIADESVWGNVDSFSFADGQAQVKAFRDVSGLYVWIDAKDDTVVTRDTANIWNGDCIQLRVASGETLLSGTPVKGIVKKDRILTVSPAGAAAKSYLNASALMFYGGFDVRYAVAETQSGYAAVIFIPAYALGLEEESDVGICVGVIDNRGNGMSAFSDFIFSASHEDPSSYRIIGD